jgi:hypothetical protein
MPHKEREFGSKNPHRKGKRIMQKLLVIFTLLLALSSTGNLFADENFGVQPPLLNPANEQTAPTIAQDLTKDGYVPIGPDSTPVPVAVRGFNPGNGKDVSFGVVEMPKAQ